mgnify:CR=1 FL=1
MKPEMLMIHFGELSTKGANKKVFVNQLYHNVVVALRQFGVKCRYDHDHIYVQLEGVDDYDPIIDRLREISGIQRISEVISCSIDVDDIKSAAVGLLENEGIHTFKVESRRINKRYPLSSYELNCALGDHLIDTLGLKVDVHEPERVVHLILREEKCYLYCRDILGLGGYPLGMIGKVMHLLSGGIDSPVAAYSLMRRGIKIECIHFASPPYTSTAVIDKLKDIIAKLSIYQSEITLHVIPFTKIQEAIYDNIDESYCITIMRRMMVRLAERLAKKKRCLAISTGESIGQVASQTLESIQVIEEAIHYPVLRPLAVHDKLSIIAEAQRLGTFDISIRPYEDCCTIFKPRSPKTKPHLDEVIRFEGKFDFEPMLEEALANAVVLRFKNGVEVDK